MEISIKSTLNNIIFSHTCENNTIKKTIDEAINNNINLSNADLRGADLRGVDLSYYNLSNADLRGVDLRGVDLRGVDLSYSNLSYSNLRGVDLRGVKIPLYCKWNITIINDKIIKIGCKEKTIDEWVNWFENSNEIFETDRDTEDFKRIKSCFYAAKAHIDEL